MLCIGGKKCKTDEQRQTNKTQLKAELAKYRAKIRQEILNSWKQYCIQHNDSFGNIFKIMRNKLLNNSKMIHILLQNFNTDEDYEDIFEHLIKTHFEVIYTDASKIPKQLLLKNKMPKPISKRELRQTIAKNKIKIKSTQSPGIWQYSRQNENRSIRKLLHPLKNIFCICIKLSFFPKI